MTLIELWINAAVVIVAAAAFLILAAGVSHAVMDKSEVAQALDVATIHRKAWPDRCTLPTGSIKMEDALVVVRPLTTREFSFEDVSQWRIKYGDAGGDSRLVSVWRVDSAGNKRQMRSAAVASVPDSNFDHAFLSGLDDARNCP